MNQVPISRTRMALSRPFLKGKQPTAKSYGNRPGPEALAVVWIKEGGPELLVLACRIPSLGCSFGL